MPSKPRFLITTADERSWRVDQPVIFLGEWCRVYGRRHIWEKLDSVVAPEYGWGPGQQDADFTYVKQLYEQLLAELAEALNQYHDTQHSIRYWRILIGPWLYTLTAILFNRWATLKVALREFKIAGTAILDLLPEQFIPCSLNDFTEMYFNHTWNHAIIGRMLSEWTSVPCDRIAGQKPERRALEPQSIPGPTPMRRIKSVVLQGLYGLSKTLSRPDDAFFINTFLELKQDFRLQVAMGQIPKRWQTPIAPSIAPDLCVRKRFRLELSDHQDFERCIRTLATEQIPTLYLEGYHALKQVASELPWPKHPKVIFTSNSFHADDVFKIWGAEKAELGIPYVIGQHGGYYGAGKYPYTSEVNEVASADRYLTWGWTDGDPKHYPSVALKIVGMPAKKWNPKGGLLQVTFLDTRYTRVPWGNANSRKNYLEYQFSFVSALPRHIRAALTVRLQHGSLPYNDPDDVLWQTRHPSVRLDPGDGPIEPQIRRSRLFIYTYNSTGLLEALGRNIPTVAFWDPKFEALRPSAKPFFGLLKTVGILHDTPDSAAAKVAEVWSDVAGWWDQPEVQDARRAFCDRYARIPENPIEVLKQALTTVVAQNKC